MKYGKLTVDDGAVSLLRSLSPEETPKARMIKRLIRKNRGDLVFPMLLPPEKTTVLDSEEHSKLIMSTMVGVQFIPIYIYIG